MNPGSQTFVLILAQPSLHMDHFFQLGVLAGTMASIYCVFVAKIAGIMRWRSLDAALLLPVQERLKWTYLPPTVIMVGEIHEVSQPKVLRSDRTHIQAQM